MATSGMRGELGGGSGHVNGVGLRKEDRGCEDGGTNARGFIDLKMRRDDGDGCRRGEEVWSSAVSHCMIGSRTCTVAFDSALIMTLCDEQHV